MIELLQKLYEQLQKTFEEKLSPKDLKTFDNGDLNVFKTFISLSKTQKDFNNLIESG